MSARADSYWQLLAASVGAPSALDRVLAGLAADQLDAGTHGRADTPSIVRQRVEAVAAYDVSILTGLADSWRPPADVAADPFWVAAWRASLRHLAHIPRIARLASAAPELASESALVWPAGSSAARSWDDLVTESSSRFTPYDEFRRWAGSPLRDASLDAPQLQSAPLLMWRVLRDRTHLLDESARNHVRSMGKTAFRVDPLEGALLLEVLARIEPAGLAAARTQLTSLLSSIADAREVIPLAYVLAGDNWRAP